MRISIKHVANLLNSQLNFHFYSIITAESKKLFLPFAIFCCHFHIPKRLFHFHSDFKFIHLNSYHSFCLNSFIQYFYSTSSRKKWRILSFRKIVVSFWDSRFFSSIPFHVPPLSILIPQSFASWQLFFTPIILLILICWFWKWSLEHVHYFNTNACVRTYCCLLVCL